MKYQIFLMFTTKSLTMYRVRRFTISDGKSVFKNSRVAIFLVGKYVRHTIILILVEVTIFPGIFFKEVKKSFIDILNVSLTLFQDLVEEGRRDLKVSLSSMSIILFDLMTSIPI